MRWLIVAIGVSASLLFIMISASVNYQFGITLADDQTNKRLYGLASIASEGLKAGAPFFIAAAYTTRRYFPALAGVAAWMLFTAYSLVSAFGFASLNRAEITGDQTEVTRAYAAAVEERDRVQKALAALGTQRPPGAIEGDLAGKRQHLRWTSTSGCTDATVPESRAFCTAYAALEAELATAQRAGELEASLATAVAEVKRLADLGGVRQVDPQAEAIALLTGLSIPEVRNYIGSLFTLLIEFGSGLGLFLSLQYVRHDNNATEKRVMNRPVSPPPLGLNTFGDVERFCVQMVEPSEGGVVGMTRFYVAYQSWCDGENVSPLPVADFEIQMFNICDGAGIERNGRQFNNVALSNTAAPIIEADPPRLRLVDEG